MRTRMLLTASAVALVAASCAQPEPHVLSEAPRATTDTDLTSTTETTAREAQSGRFIARCGTEADGGTPGMTIFTDGSEGVTDHCLSRYYIGVQPAPGALYVPDEDAGTHAPSRQDEEPDSETTQWTPSQPRSDVDPDPDQGTFDRGSDDVATITETTRDGSDSRDVDQDVDQDERDEDGSDDASPTATTTPEDPAPTTPTDPGQTTTPDLPDPTDIIDPDPTGSSEDTPPTTTVPTVTETPDPSEPTPTAPATSTEGSAPGTADQPGGSGSGSAPGSDGSHDLPFPFGSAHQRNSSPTEVPTPFS